MLMKETSHIFESRIFKEHENEIVFDDADLEVIPKILDKIKVVKICDTWVFRNINSSRLDSLRDFGKVLPLTIDTLRLEVDDITDLSFLDTWYCDSLSIVWSKKSKPDLSTLSNIGRFRFRNIFLFGLGNDTVDLSIFNDSNVEFITITGSRENDTRRQFGIREVILPQGKNIIHISITRTKLKNIDLTPLSNCPLLNHLSIGYSSITSIDLSPLSECKDFSSLWLHENDIDTIDITPLLDCPIGDFDVSDRPVFIIYRSHERSSLLPETIRRVRNRISFV